MNQEYRENIKSLLKPSKLNLWLAVILLIVAVAEFLYMQSQSELVSQSEFKKIRNFDTADKSDFEYQAVTKIIAVHPEGVNYNGINCFPVMLNTGIYALIELKLPADFDLSPFHSAWDRHVMKNEDLSLDTPSFPVIGIVKQLPSGSSSSTEENNFIDEASLHLLFGYSYLSEAHPIKLKEDWMPIVLIGTGIFSVIFFINYFGSRAHANKCIQNLSDEQVAQAYQEYESYLTNNPKRMQMLLDNYLIDLSASTILPYKDITWIYRKLHKKYFVITVSNSICCRTFTGGTYEVFRSSGFRKTDALEELSYRVYTKNPHILLGYTPENKDLYRRYTRKH